MDDKMKALEDAAFHAWLALGEWLTKHPGPSPQHDEFLASYHELGATLEALKTSRSGK